MGKASKFKKLRKLAAELPNCETRVLMGVKLTGAELIAQGITEVKGKTVHAGDRFKQISKVPIAMNHNKNLKRNYYKAGMNGAAHYGNAVIQHVNSKIEQKSAS